MTFSYKVGAKYVLNNGDIVTCGLVAADGSMAGLIRSNETLGVWSNSGSCLGRTNSFDVSYEHSELVEVWIAICNKGDLRVAKTKKEVEKYWPDADRYVFMREEKP